MAYNRRERRINILSKSICKKIRRHFIITYDEIKILFFHH